MTDSPTAVMPVEAIAVVRRLPRILVANVVRDRSLPTVAPVMITAVHAKKVVDSRVDVRLSVRR